VTVARRLADAFGRGQQRLGPYAELPAPARVLRVPARYNTIQAAVAAASVGDRILVEPGTYFGTVSITGAARNNLQILADGGAGEVVLQGNHSQQTEGTCKFALEPLCPERAGFFLRDVAGVIIRGFTVRDFGVGAMSGNGEGFLLVNAHWNRIEQNVVTRTDMGSDQPTYRQYAGGEQPHNKSCGLQTGRKAAPRRFGSRHRHCWLEWSSNQEQHTAEQQHL